MISAFASIPMAYLAFTLEGRVDTVGAIMQGGMQVAGTALYVIITLLLKRFLNRFFGFHDTDKSIDLMVMANIVAALFVLGGLCFPEIRETAGQAAVVIMVFQGVVQIRFGYLLLKAPNNFGGLLKPFCYLNMATGLCVASLLLILVGVVLSAISDLMLATIFFNIANELKAAESR